MLCNKRSIKRVQTHKNKTTEDGQIVAMNEFGDGEIHGFRRVIKVARTVVGDQVRVKLPDNDKRYVYGSLVKLLKPSDKRVDPDCKAFNDGCGGCQWLHFDYAEQLRWKTKILRNLLKQRCSSPVRVNEIIPMDVPYAYRNKLSLRNIKGRFANMQDFDDTIITSECCRVETIPNQHARKILMSLTVPHEILQAHLRSTEDGNLGMHLFVSRITPSVREFAQKVTLEVKGLIGVVAQVKDKTELLCGMQFLEYKQYGLVYQIPLNGFFQTNFIQARCLLDITLKQLALSKSDAVLDLYCGCGYFTLPIARKVKTVLGIENNRSSTDTATANAVLNGLSNVRFQTSDVAIALRNLKAGEWPLALIDPPRAGCDEAVLKEIVRLAPRCIVYVSCLPSALARDLKQLMAASYTVSYCQPIDMFPHTAHMETIVTLSRR